MLIEIFYKNIIEAHGKTGKQWLDSLDHTVFELAKKWGLSGLAPFNNLTFNYVLFGEQEGIPVVLKVGIEHDVLAKESLALRTFGEKSTVRLINECPGALLMRRAIPGDSLKTLFPERDGEATVIAANLMRELHSQAFVESDFSNFDTVLSDLDNDQAHISQRFLQKARKVKEKLLKNPTKLILLHGDLHQDNILRDGSTWKAIDPKALIGDIGYEISSFIINPIRKIWQQQDHMHIIKNRIKIFSRQFGLDHKYIGEWGFIRSVLSWIWAGDVNNENHSRITEIFDSLVE